jgi:hypothetical protein
VLLSSSVACSGRVERNCQETAPAEPAAGCPDCDGEDASPTEPAASCEDDDQDGFYAFPLPEAGCAATGGDLELPDCDDYDALVHPYAVERLGDGEDWNCDGLDGVEDLCIDESQGWVGSVPAECPNQNLVIQTRQTCNVCSGTDTYVLVRLVDAYSTYYEQTSRLVLVMDSDTVVELEVPEVDDVSATYAVPARWFVDAYLRVNACFENQGFVSQRTNHDSCTL